jgi:AraC family transcriptional regulator, transcriptional activator of the genes for pyochelin and ferripyochelin receptors
MISSSASDTAVAPDLRSRADVHQYLSLFSDRLIISAGTMKLAAPASGAGPLKKGLKVVVILTGKERIELEGHPTLEINGPQSCVILNEHESNKVHWVASDIPLRFVLVQMDPSLAQDELGIDLAAVMKQSGETHKPLLHVHTGNHVLESLASQIVTGPMRGAMRQMYLAGKGFELVSSALNSVLGTEAEDLQLSSGDIKRVHAAYDRLISALDQPLSLAELGREVGLSTSKLTHGFRRAFGTTVFGILQEHRLQQAHKFLTSGQMTVSEAAYRVGYSPAHFATIFRQRFGVSPSKLRKN